MNIPTLLIVTFILAVLAVGIQSQVAGRRASEADATKPSPPAGNQSVTVIKSNEMAAAFAKGMPVLENSQFKVHAARRQAPGEVEIHQRDTDIFYIMEGSAVFVTGGTALGPKNIAPDEIRGTEIQGGETRQLSKGDMIVIPRGVPHWFKQVEGTLLYYVVKVTSAAPK